MNTITQALEVLDIIYCQRVYTVANYSVINNLSNLGYHIRVFSKRKIDLLFNDSMCSYIYNVTELYYLNHLIMIICSKVWDKRCFVQCVVYIIAPELNKNFIPEKYTCIE